MTTGESIWDKVDYGLVTTPSSAASSDTPKDAEFEANRRFWRKARPCLDVVASLLWLYGALKVFIVDIDQKLLGSVADYRFFAFLVGLVILLAVFRKPSRILGAILYLVFFPIVVLCWKLPRAVYRSKSWVTAFAVMNVFSAVFSHLRYTVLYVAVGAFATLFILVGSSRVVLAIGATAVAALLLTSIARATWNTLRPSRFLSLQQRAIKHAVNLSSSTALQPGSEDWRGVDADKFSAPQQEAFVQSLSNRLLVHRALNFWAYQLDQYRQSPASMFFSALSFVSLVFQTALAFTLINRAIYEMDAEAFDYSSSPSMIVFVRYSLDSMTAGEIDALKPVSDLAHGASVAATVVGVVILLALFISLFLAHRQHRSDVEMRGTVDEIRAEGKRLERQLKQDFEVSAAEGLERLRDLRAGLLGFILFFNARVPPEFDEDPEFNEPDRPAGGQLPSQIDST